jgi:hypothetical protein
MAFSAGNLSAEQGIGEFLEAFKALARTLSIVPDVVVDQFAGSRLKLPMSRDARTDERLIDRLARGREEATDECVDIGRVPRSTMTGLAAGTRVAA